MKNKEKYNIRYMTFNVSQNKNGIVKFIDIYYDVKRIEKIKFLSETSATQAMNAIGNWLEEEYVPDILTDKEKAYLSAVIKPFREDVKCIMKFKRYPVACHSLRKSYGRWYWDSTHDLLTTQKLLMHESAAETMLYIMLEPSDIQEVRESINHTEKWG